MKNTNKSVPEVLTEGSTLCRLPGSVSIVINCYTIVHFMFPTCQVRVVKFYVSCPAASFSSSSSAGPQLQALDRSVPRRTRTATSGSECSSPTSTASARSQCSQPDLNHKGSPKKCQIESQKECQKICEVHMPERMSEKMSGHMPERIPEKMPDRMSE